MTRLLPVISALAMTAGLALAASAACGSHPGSPGELPPVAPRPEPDSPGATPLRTPAPTLAPHDGGPGMTPGPVSTRVIEVPVPELAPVVGEPARDAGTSDGYSPPLPPLPDGGVQIDARLEPR